ncbi:hypothetical protein L195_g062224, partial [Trifolium pratense]
RGPLGHWIIMSFDFLQDRILAFDWLLIKTVGFGSTAMGRLGVLLRDAGAGT